MTIEDLADDIACVLDDAQVDRAVLIGHSMGVQVALETYRRHEERIAGLVLLCGASSHPLKTFRGSATLEDLLPIDPRENVYMLRVVGNSMIDDHITDGDLVLVEQTSTAQDGEIVVAVVDGEATLKRIYRERDGSVRLQPANAAMEPVFIRPGRHMEIRGIVRGVLRRY